MPESPGNIEEIHNSLKASLSRGHSDLDKDVVAASKRVLLEKILFQPASASYTMQRDVLRTKYIPLNPAPQDGNGWAGGESSQKQRQQGANAMASTTGCEKNGDCLPTPKVVIYPEERLKMEWTRMTRIGAGLVNMGNTCFFNSTLQCLTYTVPLVNYCFTNDHREKCKKKDFCMMCEIQNHIKSSLDCGGRSIKPHSMLQKLRCIAKHMKWGRQEDAHEFLRFVVDHLQQACLNGETKLDRFSKETTVINQIFGGYLRSQVTCLKCQAKSDTFDPFMDLSLDIKGVSTVEEALAKFVKPETLENENAYKCPKCKNKVRAQKRFSIEKAPNVLTLQLNRFDFHHHLSGKINRFIKYPEKINLRNYMSQRLGDPVLYHLYGVLVHSGHSSEHGHYYSFVKSPSKAWYCMNDSIVHQAGSNAVFSADAYVLFYARINKSTSNGPSTPNNNLNRVKSPSSPIKSPFIGPTLPSHFKQEPHLVNGLHGKPTCEIGTPIKHQQTNQVIQGGTTGSKLVSNATVLPGTHNKISFPILTPLQKKQHLFQQQLQKDEIKRIVLQIKNGNSTTMEKSPDGKSKVVNGDISKQNNPVGLVPYYDDSDSEQENVDSQNSIGVKVHNQKLAATSSFSLQTADSQRAQSCAQKLTFPSSADNVGSRNISPTKSVSGNQASSGVSQSHREIPQSSCNAQPQSATSCLKNGSKDLQPKQASSQSSLATSSKNINHKDLLLSPKHGETHRDLSLPKSSPSTSLAAGKGSFVELPVVNMSSYADPSSAKVKSAGGNWLVQAQDCAPSPRSSCSSSNSVNSTTEWTVESKDKSIATKCNLAKVHEPAKGCVNRTVTPFPPVDRSSTSNKNNNNTVMPEVVKLKDSQPVQASTPVPAKSPSDHSSVGLSHVQPDRPTTPVEISEKLSLLHSPSNSAISDSVSRKEKKHKKKHKKDSDLWGYEKLRDDSSSRSDSSLKKKKKHKKEKKRKHKDSVNSDSDSHEGTRDRNGDPKHKYSRMHSDTLLCSDEDREKHRKKRSESEDSDDGYEWVEKTIETTNVRDTSSKSSRASVQSWNHHVKDDVAPKKQSLLDKIKTTWDGSRSSKLGMNQDGSSLTFGNSVIAWDGHKNHNDRDVESEKARKKRQWSDDYNEEIDAGKTKKVKTHSSETQFSSDNLFQRYQSMKFRHEPYRDNGPSWSQDHSYHQNQDHYQKSSQFQWMNKNNNYRLQNRHESQFKSFKPYSSSVSH